jgi:hypothetical protein
MKMFPTLSMPAWLTLGLILAAIIPFIGGVLSAGSESFVGKKRSKARLKRNLIIVGSLLSISGALLGALVQGRDNYELWAYSTGAADYCYLWYTVASSNALKFSLLHEGKYPVYDVTLVIIDTTRRLELGPPVVAITGESPAAEVEQVLGREKQVTTSISVGTVHTGGVGLIWDAPIPKNDLQKYHVTIWARNGTVEEEILLRRTKEETFTQAVRVFKSPGTPGATPTEFLTEDVPAEFRNYYPNAIPW